MDKVISIYWFVILAIVATAVVLMTSAFYNAPYDVREAEAKIFSTHIADCISKNGEIENYVYENGFKEEFKANFKEICNLNLDVEDFWKESQYYIDVEFFNVSNPSLKIFEIKEGNLNFASSCAIQEGDDFDKLAQCYEARFYSSSQNAQFLIKITTSVGKTIKNVK